jgi:hypothetical protein
MELFIRSLLSSLLGITVALIVSLGFASVVFELSIANIKGTLIKYQYGLAISYMLLVFMVWFEQIYKIKKKGTQ